MCNYWCQLWWIYSWFYSCSCKVPIFNVPIHISLRFGIPVRWVEIDTSWLCFQMGPRPTDHPKAAQDLKPGISEPWQSQSCKKLLCQFLSGIARILKYAERQMVAAPSSEGAATWTGLPSLSCCKTSMHSHAKPHLPGGVPSNGTQKKCLILLIFVDLLTTLVICRSHGLSHCKSYILGGWRLVSSVLILSSLDSRHL